MSVHTPPTKRHHRTSDTTELSTEGRAAGPTIVASLTAGAAIAVVLVMVAFPGTTEAATTGLVMLGFSLGWTLMAFLTVRRTRQPQRWAYVPAVSLFVTGGALLISTPSDQTMSALNWVWPPLMVGLALWMFTQARRSVHGKARWVLLPLIATMVLVSVTATYGNIARAVAPSYDPPGAMYDVGGHRLHLDCHGHGSPTVVLDNGLGEITTSWARIAGPLSSTTRVCAYDRAGQGWSDETDSPRDGIESAEELHALLDVAGEQGPFVIAGHSIGGPYALTFAARYPDQVAGLVLLDSTSPEQFDLPAYPGVYAMLQRLYGVLPSVSRLGLTALVPGSSGLPPTDAAVVDAMTSTAKMFRNQRDEVSILPELFDQAQALTAFDGPVAVLTASGSSADTEGWVAAQEKLAALSPDTLHQTVQSTHQGLLDDAGPAAESIRAITEVIDSVRTGTPLTAP